MGMETLTRMNPELWIENWRPKRPLAGDTKQVAYRMSREEAIKKQFIQLQGASNYKNVISLDYDIDEAAYMVKEQTYDLGILPEYNWLTVNPLKGTAQVGYFIERAVGTEKGLSWHRSLEKGLQQVSGSDENFTGHKGRNPLHGGQVTEWGTSKIYTLAELAAFVEKKPAHFYKHKKPLEPLGRHNILFNDLSSWAYREWRKPNFETRIILEAQRINQDFAELLPYSHLMTTARSILGFISRNFSEEEFSKIQAARSRKRWGNTKEETRQRLLDYLELGFTPREISELEGKTLNATRTAIRRAKGLL